MRGCPEAVSLHVRFEILKRLVKIRRDVDQAPGAAKFRLWFLRFILPGKFFHKVQNRLLRGLGKNLRFLENLFGHAHDFSIASKRNSATDFSPQISRREFTDEFLNLFRRENFSFALGFDERKKIHEGFSGSGFPCKTIASTLENCLKPSSNVTIAWPPAVANAARYESVHKFCL